MSESSVPHPDRMISREDLARAIERHRAWLEEGRALGIITESRTYADLEGDQVAGAERQRWMDSKDRLWIDGLRLEGEDPVELDDAVLDGARIRGAFLREGRFFQVRLGRAWLGRADLSAAHLGNADLRRAGFQHANLSGAYLGEARLIRANLTGANLTDAKLEGADLREVDLTGADLTGADLRRADLRGANLEGAILSGARLRDASLRQSNLRDVDLRTVTGLQADQLAGAQLSGARLPPDLHEFNAPLKHVEEAASSAQKLFVTVLLACLYSLLTIAATTDARLLTNSAASPLPVLGTEVPIVSFHLVAPVLVLALYLYFHLYLQRLWEGMAALPAVFPDGRALDRKAYPWLLGGLVRSHARLLRGERPALSRLQTAASLVTGWWVVPATLLAFWVRGLPRHDWTLSGSHALLLAVATGAACAFQRLMRDTLRDEPAAGAHRWLGRRRLARGPGVALAGVVAVAGVVTWGAIEGGYRVTRATPDNVTGLEEPAGYDPRSLVPRLLSGLRYRSFLVLDGEDLSVKPPGWSAAGEAALTSVRPAALAGRDLHRAHARQAFLVRAELAGANLRDADLRETDLRGANLGETNWSYFWRERSFALMPLDLAAPHRPTDLRRARLNRANLQGAILQGADLRGADLRLAALKDAVLVGADLRTADLRLADLRGAQLKAARLRGAKVAQAMLSRADLRDVDFAAAELKDTDLACADLRGARLAEVAGLISSQVGAARIDAATSLPPGLVPSPPGGASAGACWEDPASAPRDGGTRPRPS